MRMNRWTGKVALVTGAGSDQGFLIVKDLLALGFKVLAVDHSEKTTKNLAEELKGNSGELKPFKCDARSEDDIKSVFDWAESNWGTVDVLINNAAALYLQPLTECRAEELKTMFETNVVGLSLFAKNAVRVMKNSGTAEGHIINVNSYVGHIIFGVHGMAPYCATKNAVTVLTEALRRELGPNNRSIKITSLSPGIVQTEMTDVLEVDESTPKLKAQNISDAVLYLLSTPPGVNVTELTIMKCGDVIY